MRTEWSETETIWTPTSSDWRSMSYISNDTVWVKILRAEGGTFFVQSVDGGTFRIPVSVGLKDAPRAGEIWLASEVSKRNWVFIGKRNPIRKASSMKVGMHVLAETCIGVEDAVVAALRSVGVDEVFLQVSNWRGKVYWNSPSAAALGLVVQADVLGAMSSRLSSVGIATYAVLHGGMFWSSAAADTLCQRRYVSGAMPSIVTDSGEYCSPVEGLDAVRGFTEELGEYEFVDGVALRLFCYEYEAYDVSPSIVSAFHEKTGKYPPVDVDTASADFWQWQDFRESLWTSFYSSVSSVLPLGKQFIALLPQGYWAPSVMPTGRLQHGLSDGIFDKGAVTFVGCEVDNPDEICGATSDGRVGGFQFALAQSARLAKHYSAHPLITLDLRVGMDYVEQGIRNAVKYGMAHVVLFDDGGFLVGDDATMRVELASAIESTRLYDDEPVATVGFLCSSDTRDVSTTGLGYAEAVASAAASLANNTGHKIRVLFDSDLDGIDDDPARTLVMLDTQNMSESGVSAVKEWNQRSDKSVVVVGRCGNKVGRSSVDSGVHPFWGVDLVSDSVLSSKTFTLSSMSPVIPSGSFTVASVRAQKFATEESLLLNIRREYVIGLVDEFVDTTPAEGVFYRAKFRSLDGQSDNWSVVASGWMSPP